MFFNLQDSKCHRNQGRDEMICRIPPASQDIKDKVKDKANHSGRKKRDVNDDKCMPFVIIVKMDGLEQGFNISYCVDPTIDRFEEVVLFSTNQQYLSITVVFYIFCITSIKLN